IVLIPNAVHSIGNPNKMFQEPVSDLLVSGILLCQNERDLKHVLTIEGHPGRAICLVKMPAGWQLSTAIEHSDVVQPEKASGEDISTLRVFPVYPPIKIQHQALE